MDPEDILAAIRTWVDSLPAAVRDLIKVDWEHVGRPLLLSRADARRLLALVLELERRTQQARWPIKELREVAAVLTAAISPTDYRDRQDILDESKAWGDWLSTLGLGEAGTKVTERHLSDLEERE